jgi:hypothetical protein
MCRYRLIFCQKNFGYIAPPCQNSSSHFFNRLFDTQNLNYFYSTGRIFNSIKTCVDQVKIYGEQIKLCDDGKALKVKQEKYEEAKGFKIRRDDLKLKRDRAIDESLHPYGFSLDYFLNRVASNPSSDYSSGQSTSDRELNNARDDLEYLHMEEPS